MKNPLHKRYIRELKDDFGKYVVICILLVISIGFVSGFEVADGSLIKACVPKKLVLIVSSKSVVE